MLAGIKKSDSGQVPVSEGQLVQAIMDGDEDSAAVFSFGPCSWGPPVKKKRSTSSTNRKQPQGEHPWLALVPAIICGQTAGGAQLLPLEGVDEQSVATHATQVLPLEDGAADSVAAPIEAGADRLEAAVDLGEPNADASAVSAAAPAEHAAPSASASADSAAAPAPHAPLNAEASADSAAAPGVHAAPNAEAIADSAAAPVGHGVSTKRKRAAVKRGGSSVQTSMLVEGVPIHMEEWGQPGQTDAYRRLWVRCSHCNCVKKRNYETEDSRHHLGDDEPAAYLACWLAQHDSATEAKPHKGIKPTRADVAAYVLAQGWFSEPPAVSAPLSAE